MEFECSGCGSAVDVEIEKGLTMKHRQDQVYFIESVDGRMVYCFCEECMKEEENNGRNEEVLLLVRKGANYQDYT